MSTVKPGYVRPLDLRNGRIEYDKPVSETSVEELTELVVAEYRKARTGGDARA